MKVAFLSLILLGVDLGLAAAIYFSLPNPRDLTTGDAFFRTSFQDQEKQIKIDPKSHRYVPLKKIPETLKRSVVFLEDGKFWNHRGFDLFELKEAVKDTAFEGRRLRGASTLSQQLVKNIYLYSDRTWWRKLKEALITLKLEDQLSKSEILELYLNSIDWGRNLIGIHSASQYYFGVFPHELTVRQASFLAAIIPNPSRFGERPDKLFVRRQSLRALEHLYRTGVIDLPEFQQAVLQGLPDE